MTSFNPDLDPSSLREWLAAVGLVRLASETTIDTSLVWQRHGGRFSLVIDNAPDDLAVRAASWIAANKSAWTFADRKNADFDAGFWRAQTQPETETGTATDLEQTLWCAVASDGVPHRSGDKLQASRLEYAHGGGHQNWLASLRAFLAVPITAADIARVLAGEHNHRMAGEICRWDPGCERAHAYRLPLHRQKTR